MTDDTPAQNADQPDPSETPPARRNRFAVWARRIFYLLAAIAVALGIAWLVGPREPVVTASGFDAGTIGADLDAYVTERESRFDDIKPGQQKEIVWAFPASKAKTPVSLVYLHGFSASRGETAPMTEVAASALSANVFYTRLAGHGRTNDAMAGPSVEDWMADTAEAIAIGNRLGEKTILVTVSTGGTLAALAAFEDGLSQSVDGIVFISPNFQVKATGSQLLTVPFARNIVPVVAGQTRSFEPQNDLHAEYWTYEYPTVALLPMAASVKAARALPFERAAIPALFIFNPDDQVVDSAVTAEIAQRWGANARVEQITDDDDPYNHVIAGDALSPSTTEPIATIVADWVRGL